MILWSQNIRLLLSMFSNNSILICSVGNFIDDTKQIVVPEFSYLFSNTLNFRVVFVTIVRRFKINH